MGRFRDLLARLERVLELSERALERALPARPDPEAFARHLAFRWEPRAEGDGRLVPVREPSLFDLDDLVGVEGPVARLVRNTEQFVRGRSAPNGTVELLLDAAARAMAASGAAYLTMGLVPLSERTWLPAHYNPLWLRLLLTWVRAHGRRASDSGVLR